MEKKELSYEVKYLIGLIIVTVFVFCLILLGRGLSEEVI